MQVKCKGKTPDESFINFLRTLRTSTPEVSLFFKERSHYLSWRNLTHNMQVPGTQKSTYRQGSNCSKNLAPLQRNICSTEQPH